MFLEKSRSDKNAMKKHACYALLSPNRLKNLVTATPAAVQKKCKELGFSSSSTVVSVSSLALIVPSLIFIALSMI
jgi:hypothetical protein